MLEANVPHHSLQVYIDIIDKYVFEDARKVQKSIQVMSLQRWLLDLKLITTNIE